MPAWLWIVAIVVGGAVLPAVVIAVGARIGLGTLDFFDRLTRAKRLEWRWSRLKRKRDRLTWELRNVEADLHLTELLLEKPDTPHTGYLSSARAPDDAQD